jgi:glycosyltransferase involved in cell wall biosynthesis
VTRKSVRLGRFRLDSTMLRARQTLSMEAARLAAAFRPSLVESHDWSGPLWSAPARPLLVRLHGASSVCARLRGKRPSRLLKFFERRNLRMADAVVTPSGFIGQSTFDAFRLRGKSFTILHHGVDTRQFHPAESTRDPNEVLFVGTIKPQKGVQELFQAMPRIFEAAPQARFTFVGRHPAEPSQPCSPQALLQTLPAVLRPRVRFLGHVPRAELPDIYSRAAVAVVPSHTEAFGLTCVEAMACGAAVVMTLRGSGPELVEHGRSGLLVDPFDIGALACAVARLLGNADLRRQLGAAARSRAIEKFDLGGAAVRNIALYEELASRFSERVVYV